MSQLKNSILVIDDDASLREICQRHLENAHYKVNTAASATEGLEYFNKIHPDLVLLDLKMPDGTGQELLDQVMAHASPPPVIIITAFNDARMAVQLLQQGAKDYLVKPFPREELLHAVHQQLELNDLRTENQFLKKELSHVVKEDHLINNDPASKKYVNMSDQAARSNVPLLIHGSSGCGKHTLSRHVHYMSERRTGPLVEISLNTLQPSLMESILFGHKKGAFTGADQDHKGVFEEAHKGTLILSGYEEMPVELQAKFLRVMETKKIRALGNTSDNESDFRVISLFQSNPQELVSSGELREDLFFRLNVVSIEIPPLCERRQDIWPLACYFASLFGREIHLNSRAFIESHSWPGNARELKNRIEQSHVFQENGPLDLAEGWNFTEKTLSLRPLDNVLLEHVQFVLNASNGNKSQAAKILGISRRTLYTYLKEN